MHIAIVVRGAADGRLGAMLDALRAAGFAAEVVAYDDGAAGEVRERLLTAAAALVWVDPITDGQDRTVLDELLRGVAAAGVLVSAHPDVILAMGTKEVLYRTRELGWGADTQLYRTAGEFRRAFPERLAAAGTRVLKQRRGNGGEGVWKVQRTAPDEVRVQHARVRDSATEDLGLGEFMRRCEAYFAAPEGCLIDQAFQPRISDGLVRCYLVQDRVVGFARQLAPDGAPADRVFGLPSAKTMYAPGEPTFQDLRGSLEGEWLPAMQRLLAIPTSSLPLLWDADFLFGPPAANGRDSYVLCEINVSCVIPFPPAAPAALAAALSQRLAAREQ